MTLEEDRAEIVRIAANWRDVSPVEQEDMLTTLGKMLDYLDPTDNAEYQLSLDTERLHKSIETAIRHQPKLHV